jgi:hypothetical protein
MIRKAKGSSAMRSRSLPRNQSRKDIEPTPAVFSLPRPQRLRNGI